MTTPSTLLRAASRTFAIGIERLPARLRSQVRTSYLLLRVSDYLEDNEEMPPERKHALLLLWADVLRGDADRQTLASQLRFASSDDLSPDAQVASRLDLVCDELAGESAAAREIIVRHVADSTLGMARWAERGPRIDDEADLDDYMHEVAGRVGWLLTELFALEYPELRRREAEMMRLGREFGLGLQTVNVIRGMAKDVERGWIYVPADLAASEGLPREALFDEPHRAAGLRVVEKLADKADRHLAAAIDYVAAIPRRRYGVRVFCLLPLFFAIRTLAVSRGDERVLTDEVKIGRDEVRRITRTTLLFAPSNRWIRRYAARLRTG